MPQFGKYASVVVTTTEAEAYFPNCGMFGGIVLSKEICLIHVYECQHSSEISF